MVELYNKTYPSSWSLDESGTKTVSGISYKGTSEASSETIKPENNKKNCLFEYSSGALMTTNKKGVEWRGHAEAKYISNNPIPYLAKTVKVEFKNYKPESMDKTVTKVYITDENGNEIKKADKTNTIDVSDISSDWSKKYYLNIEASDKYQVMLTYGSILIYCKVSNISFTY